MSKNSFSYSILDWLYGLHRLKYLDLRYSNLHRTIYDVWGNLTSPVELDLSINQSEATIRTSWGNLCNLGEIDFLYLKLNQQVNDILEILALCISHGLTTFSQFDGLLTFRGIFQIIFQKTISHTRYYDIWVGSHNMTFFRYYDIWVGNRNMTFFLMKVIKLFMSLM